MARYVWDKAANTWVPRGQGFAAPGPSVISDADSFVSPIDGKVIGGRAQAREHMQRHGVVDRREFKGHKYQRAQRPSVTPDVVAAYKQVLGKL